MLPNYVILAQKYTEYDVKAAYLEKFTRFIEWPENTGMIDESTSFVLGIMGKTPLSSYIKKKYEKQEINNKNVEIRYISGFDQIDGCNLLFISGTEYAQLDKIYLYLKNKPVLTICDDIRFSHKGIHIVLFIRDNHVYFEIDQNALDQSGLYANSLLMELSKTIITGEGG